MKIPAEVEQLNNELARFKDMLWSYNFSREDLLHKMRQSRASPADLRRLANAAEQLATCARQVARSSSAVAVTAAA